MNRYFFNFRNGSEISRDSLGMFLSNADEAQAEALQTCRDLAMISKLSGESALEQELQVLDASGEPVLVIPIVA